MGNTGTSRTEIDRLTAEPRRLFDAPGVREGVEASDEQKRRASIGKISAAAARRWLDEPNVDRMGLLSGEYWRWDQLLRRLPSQWHDGGLRTADIASALGVSTRVVIRWVENDYIHASQQEASGHGSRRLYSLHDFVRAYIVRQLIDHTRGTKQLAVTMAAITDDVLEDASHVFVRDGEDASIVNSWLPMATHLEDEGDLRDLVTGAELQALRAAYASATPTLIVPVRTYKRAALELLADG